MKSLISILLIVNSCLGNTIKPENSKEENSKNIINVESKNNNDNEAKDINIEIDYTLKMKLDEKLKNFPKETQDLILAKMGGNQTYKLTISEGKSYYQLYQNLKLNSDISEKEEPGKKTTTTYNYSFSFSNYYKDFKNNEMLEQKSFQNKLFLIEREILNFEWTIKSEIYEIGGYKCKYAETNYNGNLIKAWFTEDIPVSDGPLIYNGLPGLILKIETPDREIYATKVEFKEKVKVVKPTEGEKKTKDEMDKMLEELKSRQGYEKKDGNRTEKMTIIRSN